MEECVLVVTVIIIFKRTIIGSTTAIILLFFYLFEFCRYCHEDFQMTTKLAPKLGNGDDFFTEPTRIMEDFTDYFFPAFCRTVLWIYLT